MQNNTYVEIFTYKEISQEFSKESFKDISREVSEELHGGTCEVIPC